MDVLPRFKCRYDSPTHSLNSTHIVSHVGAQVKKKQFGIKLQARNDPCYKGSFFDGDSYIILQTRKRDRLYVRDIFFWLGAESSQDEKGVAAYKTVELDEFFGGEPTQHRETQGHETGAFKALFKEGVTYRKGGIASGFRSTSKKDEFVKRLLHVKGRRNITVTQVATLSHSPTQPNSV